MITNSLQSITNLLHAQLCYQLFITPLHRPLEKKYRDFARMACEVFELKRTDVIHKEYPRHHVLHVFKQSNNPHAKKILITHGWMSRAAYMIRFVQYLHKKGYEVHALDFPAHGDAKGIQLPWTDAVDIIRHCLNENGPFYGVLGHSFGGSMLLNTLNLAGQLPQWHLKHKPEKAVLIASPTQMRTPISAIARRLKLNGQAYLCLKHMMQQQIEFALSSVHLSHFTAQSPDIPFLCVHGKQDLTIHPKESERFCSYYNGAELALLDNADHVSVLMDKRVEDIVGQFFARE